MNTAKLFQNGSSQAVRLPKEYRFEGDEVGIKRVGNTVILVPLKKTWQILEESLSMFSDDFMSQRNQPDQKDREGLS